MWVVAVGSPTTCPPARLNVTRQEGRKLAESTLSVLMSVKPPSSHSFALRVESVTFSIGCSGFHCHPAKIDASVSKPCRGWIGMGGSGNCGVSKLASNGTSRNSNCVPSGTVPGRGSNVTLTGSLSSKGINSQTGLKRITRGGPIDVLAATSTPAINSRGASSTTFNQRITLKSEWGGVGTRNTGDNKPPATRTFWVIKPTGSPVASGGVVISNKNTCVTCPSYSTFGKGSVAGG